jgi:hypothetical protein
MLLTWWTLIKPSVKPANNFFTVGIPGQGGTGKVSLYFTFFLLWVSFNGSNWFSGSAHQIPDFNSIFSTNTNPLHFWIESDLINGGTSIKFSRVVGKI